MRIVFAGTPEVALPSLEALAAAGHEVLAVVTRPDAPAGRGKRLKPSPVARWGLDHGVEVLRPVRPRDDDFVVRLGELAPDVCPVVAYGAIIPDHVLTIPEHGWVNLHFSLLPAWRGAAPAQRALIAGESVVGATTFAIVRELDAGPVYRRWSTEVETDEVAGDLLARLATQSAHLLVDTLADIDAGVVPEPQPTTGITVAPKITVDEARLDWARSASELANLVRGTSPSPGAWTTFAGERFKVLLARPVGETTLSPGELRASRRDLRMGTGDGDLDLVTVQAVGKRPMSGAEWARGIRLVDGVRCE